MALSEVPPSCGQQLRVYQVSGSGLDERLGARGDPEFPAGIVEVKLYGAFAQAQDLANLGKRLAARRPGEGFKLAPSQVNLLGPECVAGNTCEARRDDGRQYVMVNRLGDII